MATKKTEPTKQDETKITANQPEQPTAEELQAAEAKVAETAKDSIEPNEKKTQSSRDKYIKVVFPKKHARPYSFHSSKTGKTYDMARVYMPEGSNINGIDVSHYSFTVFMNTFIKSQIANGEPISVLLPKSGTKEEGGHPINLSKLRDKDDPFFNAEHPERNWDNIKIKNPWDIVTAVNEAKAQFKANREAEEAEKGEVSKPIAERLSEDKGVSHPDNEKPTDKPSVSHDEIGD